MTYNTNYANQAGEMAKFEIFHSVCLLLEEYAVYNFNSNTMKWK